MDDKAIQPIFLVDGFPQSGCSTLSRLIANTYALELVDIHDIMWQLFSQTPYATQKTPLALAKGYTEFLRNEIATKPEVLRQIFDFIDEKIMTAQKPILINATGAIGYTLLKNYPSVYRLFVQCEGGERAERIYRDAKAPVTLTELDEMVKTLVDQDNLWSNILKDQFAINIFHDEPEHKVIFINSSKTPAEQLFQQITAQPEFIEAIKSIQTLLPEVGQEWNRWKCFVCGFVYEGVDKVTTCPKCGNNNPDKFGDTE